MDNHNLNSKVDAFCGMCQSEKLETEIRKIKNNTSFRVIESFFYIVIVKLDEQAPDIVEKLLLGDEFSSFKVAGASSSSIFICCQ